MAYTILTSGNSFQILDGTLNSSNTTLALPGKNYAGYGLPVNQDLVDLAENYARYTQNDISNNSPLTGQIWFKVADPNVVGSVGTLYVNQGNTTSPSWQAIAKDDPTANINADYIFTDNITASPNANGFLTGSWTVVNSLIVGNAPNNGTFLVNGQANVSNTLGVANATVVGSITANTTANIGTDVTVGGNITAQGNVTALGGTSANAGSQITNLRGSNIYYASAFFDNIVLPPSANITAPGVSGDVIFNNNGNFAAAPGSTFTFIANVLTARGFTASTGIFTGDGAGLTNLNGANVTGVVPFANNVVSGGNITTGNVVANSVQTPILTTGDISTAGSVTGNWTLTPGSRWNATYADLAERYAADAVYAPGTVVELGGTHEITRAITELSTQVFGVISDSAGYVMNAAAGDDATHPTVAMTGRVRVNAVGKVAKFDRLVCAGNGYARTAVAGEATAFTTIGRALEDKTTEEAGQVLAVVSAKL